MVKYVCKKCIKEEVSDTPCIFSFKKGLIDYERDDWKDALQLCPFRNSTKGKFTDELVFAEWERMKKC